MHRRCNLRISCPLVAGQWDKIYYNRHTDPDGDDPVRQLSSKATIAIEKVVAELVAGGALAEGRHTLFTFVPQPSFNKWRETDVLYVTTPRCLWMPW
jgi:hypothetical protein